MKKYKCIKNYTVNLYDENGFLTEKTMNIKKGTIWEDRTKDIPISNFQCYLERKSKDKLQWIGITKETLKDFFIEVK